MDAKPAIKPIRGMQLLMICALLDASVGMLIKLLPWNPFVIAGCRSALAVLVLYGYYKRLGIKVRFSRNSILAGFMISAMFITFITATTLTSASNAVALQYTNPLFIVILSFFIYRQKPSRLDILSVAGVLLGIILIFGGAFGIGGMTGNILALISAVSLAGMFMFINHVKDPAESYGALISGHIITFFVSIWFIFTYPPVLNANTVLYILILGLLQQGVGNIFYAYAIRACKPLTCSIILMTQLVLNPILVYLFVGEKPAVLEILGCVVIFIVSATVVILNMKANKEEVEEAKN